jgi:hypothetical protein
LDRADYDLIKKGIRRVQDDIETAKRPAYTVGSRDVLANFKRVAERSGITPLQCILVYFLKHIDSIQSAVGVHTSASEGEIPQAEPIVERFADAANYLNLMLALMIEEHNLAEVSQYLIEKGVSDD